jgi:hypothetical protein
VHHATPFYKITEIVGVQEQSAKKGNEFGTVKAETKRTRNLNIRCFINPLFTYSSLVAVENFENTQNFS